MKQNLLFLICLFILGASEVYCLQQQQQVPDSLLLTHYPVDTGNLWDYYGQADQTWWNRSYPALMLKAAKGDTLLQDGKLYKKIIVDEYGLDAKSTAYAIGYHFTWTEFVRIDTSTLEVYRIKYNDTLKLDSLRAKVNDSFRARPNTVFDTVIFKDTAYINIFGTRRLVRYLEEKQGLFEYRTAEGIGEINRESAGDNYITYFNLNGAVIKCDTLGTLLRTQDAELKARQASIIFNQNDTGQTISFTNSGKGLAIVDSIKLKSSKMFYSYPSYRSGYYFSSVFNENPFPVFPGDHVEYNIFLRTENIDSVFFDTLLVYGSGINKKRIPVINIPVYCNTTSSISGLKHESSKKDFELYQNYPNPFNPVTTISFNLPEGGNAELKIFDIRGNLVETLIKGFVKSGFHSVKFNAENLSSGIYFYQLKAGGYIQNKKFVILK